MAYPLGVDVASHQGSVDWQAVANSGVSFAFTKSTGGHSYVNPTLGANVGGIRAAGLTLGYYHFAFESSLDGFPGAGPEAEAQHFLDTIAPFGLQAGEIVALDMEDVAAYGDLSDWTLRWLAYVEQRVGFKPLFYSGAYFIAAHGLGIPALAEYGLWLAAYQATLPETPQPWPVIAFWQWSDRGNVPGVVGYCDRDVFNGDEGAMVGYGKPAALTPEPPIAPATPVYTYNPNEPVHLQEHDFDCSQDSIEWCIASWGVPTNESEMLGSMLAEGVLTQQYGCSDASGQGLASWVNEHYPQFHAEAEGCNFDFLADEAGAQVHPIAAGGAAFYHWVGVRGFSDGLLQLANPAPNWMQVGQTLSEARFNELGPWHMVRVTCPATENAPPPPEQSYAPPGSVGSGILTMMAEAGTTPASPSTWLPLGQSPALIESCLGMNGAVFYFHLPTGRRWVHSPDP